MKAWLLKTEPETFSIDDFQKKKTTLWDGVRNYQARNFLREMKKGDLALIYHSNADPSGVVGVGKVIQEAVPDPTQFDSKSDYYDPKATKAAPRWFCPTLQFSKKLKHIIPLAELRTAAKLKNFKLLQKGSRLSVIPVTKEEFDTILELTP